MESFTIKGLIFWGMGLTAVCIIVAQMVSCSQQSNTVLKQMQEQCTSVGGSWLPAGSSQGSADYQCLNLSKK